MNIPRLLLAIVVAFVFIVVSDYLIHGLWLLPAYRATPGLWRTEAEQCANLPWMLGGQFLAAAVFSLLWAKGFAPLRCFKCACMFGLMMGLFNQSNTLISYAVWPLPPMIAVKWFGSALVQGILLGIITFFVYKPPVAGQACGCGDTRVTSS
jgi:uncharacterized membrane protein AbrB (regulator of aidB expression)